MSSDFSPKSNRVNLTVPYSLLDKVDIYVEKKLEDGESRETANRCAFVLEMFKLGLRVHENKLSKDEREMTLDQKLELIAHNVITNAFITEGMFGIIKETCDQDKVVRNAQILEPDWPKEVQERVAGRLKNYFR